MSKTLKRKEHIDTIFLVMMCDEILARGYTLDQRMQRWREILRGPQKNLLCS